MHPSKKALALESAVAILVLAALVGWLFYRAQTSPSQPRPSTTASTTASGLPAKPAVKAPQDISRIVDSSVRADSIDVTSCAPKPAAARFVMGATVKFVNNDASAHRIFFSPALSFSVPAKGSQKVVFDIWKYPGLRRYDCDNSKAAGTVYLEYPQPK
jgi:hypothetical protein